MSLFDLRETIEKALPWWSVFVGPAVVGIGALLIKLALNFKKPPSE